MGRQRGPRPQNLWGVPPIPPRRKLRELCWRGNTECAGHRRGPEELAVGGASPVLLGSHSEKDARESSRGKFACVFARTRYRGVSSGAGVRGSKEGNGGAARKGYSRDSQTQGTQGNFRLTSAEGRADPRRGCGTP